jgi:hypothetical protein
MSLPCLSSRARYAVLFAGSGIAYNVGRFATALGVFFAGVLFAGVWGSYSRLGALCGLIYALGMVVIWWAPDTAKKNLQE